MNGSVKQVATWNGTDQESFELVIAFGRNCECEFQMQYRTKACEAHQAMAYDQRLLDGLLFMRRHAERLLEAEFAE